MVRWILIILILTCSSAYGQNESPESSSSGIEFTYDFLKLGSLFLDFEDKYEGAAAIYFKDKYKITMEAGYAELQPNGAFDTLNYRSKGIYFKFGPAVKFKLDPKNSIGFGILYAFNSFEDELDPKEGFSGTSITRSDLSASWVEFVMESERKLSNSIAFGWNFRVKALYDREILDPESFSIPGYGRRFDSTIPVINLFIRYRLPVF